jgi:precorrin-2 dehydrogenase/sirohydrochlorin ferrochelatase
MPVDEPQYPVHLNVSGRACLVVGGGPVARRKARGLLEAGALVTMVAPEIDQELAGLTIERRPYRSGEAADYRLVVTATGDPEVDGQVYADADAAGVWVNSADDPENCSFTLPAVVRRGQLTFSVGTGGRSPAMARWLKAELEAQFGPEHEVLLRLLSEAREVLRSRGIATEGLAWQQALDSGMLELVRAGREAEARERLQACLSSSSD